MIAVDECASSYIEAFACSNHRGSPLILHVVEGCCADGQPITVEAACADVIESVRLHEHRVTVNQTTVGQRIMRN